MRSDSERRIGFTLWWLAVAVAVAVRIVEIGRWPGLNGDESWYGVNVLEFLSGGTPFFHTGVGNPLNPIHSGLLLLVSMIFDPSPALLRVPAVILGIAAVVIAYPLLARPLGQRAAFIAAVLLAVSPTAVVYSRLGWDPSGTPLLSLLGVAFALRDRPLAAVTAYILALLIHPTNVFLAAVIAAAWAPHAIERYRRSSPGSQQQFVRVAIAAGILAIPAALWAMTRIANNPDTPFPSVSMAIDRLFSPAMWLNRAQGALELLSGTTAAIDISGPMPWAVPQAATLITATVLLASLVIGWGAFRRHRHGLWMLCGVGLTLAGFHIVAIPAAFHPGLERYALFLLVPIIILTAMTIDALSATTMRAGVSAAAVMALSMLTVLIGGYFYPLATRGGESAMTYRTGPVEPKRAAFRFIDADSRGAGAITIVAEDWWLYWSLRYFAGTGGRINVEPAPSVSIPGGLRPAGAAPPPRAPAERAYLVVFAGSALPATLTQSAPIFTATDPINRAIVQVFAIEAH